MKFLSLKAVLIPTLLIVCSSCQNKSPPKPPVRSHYASSADPNTYTQSRSINSFDDFLDETIAPKTRYYQPYYPLKMQVYENKNPEFKTFEARHQFHSPYKPLIGIVTLEQEDIDITNQLLLEIDKRITDPAQRSLMTYEVLTKVLAYRNLLEGRLISIPTLTPDLEPDITIYKVDKVFNLFDGMPAFGLVPVSPDQVPPILIFRGTDLSGHRGSSASIMADLDINGPGLEIFYSNQNKLKAWLHQVYLKDQKTQVMGYSLGGAFTEYLCLFEPDLISHNPRFPNVAFNQPGVSDELITKWHTFFPSQKPEFISFVTEGDVVSTVGQLFGNVHELSVDKHLSPIAAHLTLMSIQSRIYMYRLDVSMKIELTLSDPLLEVEE